MRTMRWIVAVLIAAYPAVVHAQHITLRGYAVHDADGRIIADAAVAATRLDDTETPFASEAITNSFGYFQLSLPPGRYSVALVLPTDVQQTLESVPDVVDLAPGFLNTIILRLRLRLEPQSVTVTQRQLPDISDTASAASFDRNDIEHLTQAHGRNIQSMLAYVPGVVITDTVGSLAQFTSLGQRRFANRLIVDGVSVDLALDVRGRGIGEAASGALPAWSTSGGTQAIVPLAAIEEIRVNTINKTSEMSGAPGAQTSVITRAGSARLLGSMFGEWRPEGLTATDWFEKARQAPLRQNASSTQGGTVGGPLFGGIRAILAWEGQSISRDITTTIDVPSMAVRERAPLALRELLSAYPMPTGSTLGGLASYSGRFPVRSKLWTVSPRLDADVGSHHAFARLTYGRSSGDALAVGTLQSPFLTYRNRETTSLSAATLGWSGSLGRRITHEARGSVALHGGTQNATVTPVGGATPMDLTALASTPAPDTFILARIFPGPSGTIAAGQLADSRQAQVQFAETVSIVRANHVWRVGVDVRQVMTSSQPAMNRYEYRYSDLDGLLSGNPAQAEITRVEPVRLLRRAFAAFAQDTWRATSRLTFDIGVRYSVTPAPASANAIQPALIDYGLLPAMVPAQRSELWMTSWLVFAPRVAIGYRLRDHDKTSSTLRASWTNVPDELTSPGGVAMGRGAPYLSARRTLVQPSATVQPTQPGTTTQFEYFAFPEKLKRPRVSEWQLGLEQAIDRTQTLGLTYVGTAGRGLPYWYAYQDPTGAMAINAYSNDGRSIYHALLASYSRRLSGPWQARVAYTWSHSIDVDSGEQQSANVPPSLLSPSMNRGPSDFDRRHVISAMASYQLPSPISQGRVISSFINGWQLATLFTVHSGTPFSVSFRGPFENGLYLLRTDQDTTADVWVEDAASPIGRRLNPARFSIPTEPRQGSLGRNALRATGLCQLDLSLTKSFKVGQATGTLRIDTFNFLNTRASGPPNTDIYDTSFGMFYQTYADALGKGTLSGGGLPPLQQSGGPRSTQISVKLEF